MIPIARPQLGADEEQAVLDVLRSGTIASGPVTEAFEREFAAAVGVKHAIAVGNGTAALHAALLAAGVGPGDEVLTTPFTFVASLNAILYAGAVPKVVDIDPRTFTLDPALCRKATGPRTKAILPVHLFGLPADMAPLQELADERGLTVVEDAAQAHGATYQGTAVGALGDLGCFSMYPTKNMTTGEGGMVTTDRDDLADLVRSIRNHGRGLATLGTYDHVRLGHNFRTTDIASAIGRVQLRRLPGFNDQRRRNARRLDEALAGHPDLQAPVEPAGRTHVYHQYTVRSRRREAFVAWMKSRSVGVGVYYPKPATDYPHLAAYRSACPNAETAAREVASLPVHPGLSAEDLEAVAAAARGWTAQ